MRRGATKNDVLESQRLARKRRADALFCIPLGVLIILTYAYLAANLLCVPVVGAQ